MVGFFYRGRFRNYYYDMVTTMFFYYGKYSNGSEDEFRTDIGVYRELEFEEFNEMCEEMESK